jgi:hypothetical protein
MTTNISEKKWVLIDIDKLIPYEKNVKKHGAEQVAKIALSIEKFGWRGAPIQVDENMTIINGHGRRLAAIKLGMLKVPVVIESGLTEDEIRAYRLADNRVGISDTDSDMLQIELADLEFDLDGIFDKKELDFLNADIMQMNTDVFSDDLDGVMDETKQSTSDKIEESSAKRVSISKALGFKDVSGQDTIFISRFMANVEANTGLLGEKAFVEFIKKIKGSV